MNHGLPPAVVLLLTGAAFAALLGVSLIAARVHPWFARHWQANAHLFPARPPVRVGREGLYIKVHASGGCEEVPDDES